MYLIVGYDLQKQQRKIYAEEIDPAKAYELAHELDAANKFGRDDDETGKLEHPCRITIEDEDGNDIWNECCDARCPSTSTGLFQ